MIRIASVLLAVAVLVCALTAPCWAKVARTSLDELAKISDYVVVGKVTNVMRASKTKVAEVTIREVLKGKLTGSKLYYLAERTWTCDITDAVKGESALLFLEKLPDDVSEETRKERSIVAAKLRASARKAPFLMIVWSGRGRMPLRTIKGTEYATLWTVDVSLPGHIKTIPGPEPEYASIIRSARLAELTAFIKAQVAKPGATKGRDARKTRRSQLPSSGGLAFVSCMMPTEVS